MHWSYCERHEREDCDGCHEEKEAGVLLDSEIGMLLLLELGGGSRRPELVRRSCGQVWSRIVTFTLYELARVGWVEAELGGHLINVRGGGSRFEDEIVWSITDAGRDALSHSRAS